MKPVSYLLCLIHRVTRHGAFPPVLMLGLWAGTAMAEPSALVVETDTSDIPASREFRHEAMHTEFIFTLCQADGRTLDLETAANEAFAAVDDLESRISRFRPDSQTSYINAHAAEKPVILTPDVFSLIAESARVNQITDGAFDITITPLLGVWKQALKEERLPVDTEIQAALAKVGMRHLTLDADARTITFDQPGIALDFGAIGKGLALDQAAVVLKRLGAANALLSAGSSSIFAIGDGKDGQGWKVRIHHPYNSTSVIGEILLKDEALSTSGEYRQVKEIGGLRIGHIFSPLTGQPARGVLSATVVGPSGAKTDGLSTAFIVMGEESVKTFRDKHPEYRAILAIEHPNEDPAIRGIGLPSHKELP